MKTMFRVISVLLIAVCALSCVACGGEKINPDASAKDIYEKTVAALALPDDGEFYYDGAADSWNLFDDDILCGKFGQLMDYPALADIKTYAAYFSSSPYETEFAVFRMVSKEKADKMVAYIRVRIQQMIDNAKNYPSVDITLIKNYEVKTDGEWVWYVASHDNAKFIEALNGVLYS